MITLAYARPTLASRDMLKGEFFTLTLFVLLGISVMCSANNFLVVYLGLELMSLSLYALTALRRDHAVATEAAMKYFVLGALASGFLLYGLSMMYGATGSLEIPKVFEAIATGRSTRRCWSSAWCSSWPAWASSWAPCPSTCGCPTSTRARPRGHAADRRRAQARGLCHHHPLLVEGMLGLAVDWQQMLIVLAVASLVVGNLAAIAQTNLKRMLAYSTIAQMGFVLLGLSAGVVSGNTLSAAMPTARPCSTWSPTCSPRWAPSADHVPVAPGLRGREIDDLRRPGQRSPWLAGVMAIFMFSLAGMPPMVGFYAKLAVLQALVSTNVTGYIVLAVVAVLLSLVGAFYYLRVVKVMYFDEPRTSPQPLQRGAGVSALLAVNGAGGAGLRPAAGRPDGDVPRRHRQGPGQLSAAEPVGCTRGPACPEVGVGAARRPAGGLAAGCAPADGQHRGRRRALCRGGTPHPLRRDAAAWHSRTDHARRARGAGRRRHRGGLDPRAPCARGSDAVGPDMTARPSIVRAAP
jgi:NADH-quinone oxidoreductase subunit N